MQSIDVSKWGGTYFGLEFDIAAQSVRHVLNRARVSQLKNHLKEDETSRSVLHQQGMVGESDGLTLPNRIPLAYLLKHRAWSFYVSKWACEGSLNDTTDIFGIVI